MSIVNLFPYIVSLVMTVLSGFLGVLLQQVYKKNVELREHRKAENLKRERAMDILVLASARRDIKHDMMEQLERGYVTLSEYEETEEAFRAYVDRGGNGTLHHLHDDRWKLLKIKEE